MVSAAGVPTAIWPGYGAALALQAGTPGPVLGRTPHPQGTDMQKRRTCLSLVSRNPSSTTACPSWLTEPWEAGTPQSYQAPGPRGRAQSGVRRGAWPQPGPVPAQRTLLQL